MQLTFTLSIQGHLNYLGFEFETGIDALEMNN
jgi:hypothetical protein